MKKDFFVLCVIFVSVLIATSCVSSRVISGSEYDEISIDENSIDEKLIPSDNLQRESASVSDIEKKPAIELEIQGSNVAGVVPSFVIADCGTKSVDRLVAFFMDNNPDGNRDKVMRLATYYLAECAIEGINSDAAFVQMCLETGFLRFGGLVTEDMNNFCGLGAIDDEHRGNVFETEQLGVRAHVQHLHAYGTTADLVQECVDSRYKWVTPRGKAPTVYELAGTWAADRHYGEKLADLLTRLSEY